MHGLVGIALYFTAAALSIVAALWALADFFVIPDSLPRKERNKLKRPIQVRTGALFTVASILAVFALMPIM